MFGWVVISFHLLLSSMGFPKGDALNTGHHEWWISYVFVLDYKLLET